MIKDKNEPIATPNLSYSDIELILTSLEHYAPRTSRAKQGVELISYFRRMESNLFKAIKETKL
tara:strand:+ start:277 stop:465 length:189 start_codon:yes stop_codon:yes gene_type:complete